MKTLFFCLPLCAAALFGADSFWDAKPFTAWSDSEVRKVMSSSPWAHEVPIPDPNAGWQSGASIGGGKGGRGAVNIPSTQAASKLKVIVFWESSLAGRQALARLKFGAEAAESRDAATLLAPDEEKYILVVTGLPAAFVKQEAAKLNETLAAKTALTIKGRPSVKPGKAEVLSDGRSVGMYFEFPKSFAIGLADKDVEFSTHIEDIDVRTTFHPAEMVFGGKLEL